MTERPDTIEVLRPGALTTVQDLGRRGLLADGVPVGGAMDRLAARIANWLVGNPEDAAVLETTMAGPELLFHGDRRVAVTGARFAGVPEWQPFEIKAGEPLSLREIVSGCRGYVAVSGGIRVPAVMGGSGTYLRAKLGGFEGRALRKDDFIALGEPPEPTEHRRLEHWRISPAVLPAYSSEPVVRVTPGAQGEWFDDSDRKAFAREPYTLLPKSDRMGLRLLGAPLKTASREMTSEPVTFGSIQVPPDGQPIVLMADGQTIGGYPRIAEVVSVDIPLLAQLRPGDHVSFKVVSLADAQALVLKEEHALARLHEGLTDKLKCSPSST